MKTITLTGFLFLFSILCFSGGNKSHLPMRASNGGFIENKGQITNAERKLHFRSEQRRIFNSAKALNVV